MVPYLKTMSIWKRLWFTAKHNYTANSKEGQMIFKTKFLNLMT